MIRSPFPGMDPYLEAHWLDVHGSLIHLAKAALQPQLGEDLVARSEERIVVEDPIGLSRAIGPDVRIVELKSQPQAAIADRSVSLAEPILLDLEAEPVVQRYLEIIDLTTGGRVITVIEFLSASNKFPGDGLVKYKQKQQECRDAAVNLVEIDLTRDGRRELLAHRWTRARRYESTYQVSAWRSTHPTRVELYPIRLQDRLPVIGIPLRPADSDARLDLQTLIDSVYSASRYDRTNNYRKPCVPPFDAEDEVWADQLLKSAGKR